MTAQSVALLRGVGNLPIPQGYEPGTDSWIPLIVDTQGRTLIAGSVSLLGTVTLAALPAGNNNIGDVDIASMPPMPTGANIVGRVGIDQTTPGTTNAVAMIDGANAALGATADAMVAAGATGSISAKLRRFTQDLASLIGLFPSALGLGGGLKASTQGTDTTTNGTLSILNAAITLDVKGMATVVTEVDAGLTGTVTYEYTTDDNNWQAIYGQNATGAGSVANNSDNSFPNRRRFVVAGLSQFRIRVSVYTSGSSAARARASASPVSGIAFGSGGATRATLETGPGSPYSSASTSTADGATGITGLATGAFLWAYNGVGHDKVRTPTIFKPFTIAASAAETTIWTPAAGKKARFMGFALFSDTATVLVFRDAAGGTVLWRDGVAANNRAASPPIGNGELSALANNVITLQCLTAATANGVVFGTEE